MTKPSIITTPDGDRMAVLPLSDYERLVAAAEDAADGRAYDEAKRRLANGEDELVPAEFVGRLLDGESPVRVWREFRGLSIEGLAAKAGTGVADLRDIENGTCDGSFGTMRKVAQALDVSLDDLA